MELHDLAATHLEFAGVDALPEADGRSLKALLAGETTEHREVAISALADWQLIWDGRNKLVIQEASEPRLFDLVADPQERDDLAGRSPELVATMSARLASEAS